MKRIYVLRHGKSDWGADYDSDHDRPLKDRGIRAAGIIGSFLTAVDGEPELVISSTAVRALTTARYAAEAGGWTCEVREEPSMYGASRSQVLDIVRGVDDDVDRVLLAGHEPTSSSFTGSLVGSAEIRFPTAALACVEVQPASWRTLEFGRGELVWFVTPKLLERAVDGRA